MTLFAGAAQVQKAYVGASAVNAIMNSGVNVLGVNGSFPGITDSNLYLPLTSTLVPTRGASTPTFTRATVAWDFDSEGKLNLNIPSGCPRFTGARLVRNRVVGSSEDFTNASWTKSRATVVGNKLLDSVDAGTHRIYQDSGIPTGTWVLYAELKASELTQAALGVTNNVETVFGRFIFDLVNGTVGSNIGAYSGSASMTPLDNGYFGCQVIVTVPSTEDSSALHINTAKSGLVNYIGTGTDGVLIRKAQAELVSGQADQTTSEYVSVGVLSAPYHGAGVDGCKWFSTNKNGSAIPAATLKGYWAEPSRVNNCLQSRKVAEVLALAVPKWYASTTGSELVTNGTFTTDTTGWLASGATATIAAVAGQLEVTCTGTGYGAADCTSAIFNGTKTLVVSATVSSAASIAFGDAVTYNKFGVYSSTDSGTQRLINVSGDLKIALLTNSNVASTKRTYDNISVKEAAIQVTTTTGLDNVANSASRLTAAANDSTLLQLLTAPTGSRTTSVWIKRISGSGTVSLTRNGGTNWTDITASLVAGTWVPVEVVSDVGANPTVGLKMGTSGDVIDVDCFQDENGAWRTSPILTTTAAVTRNADVLSYASAFDVTQGTSLCSIKSDVPHNTSDIYFLNGDSANARIGYLLSAVAKTTSYVYDGASNTNAVGLSVTTNVSKRASRWGPDLRVCADGTLGAQVAFDGSMGAVGTMYVGCNQASISHLSGNIGEVHIWNTPLTDAQMQQVTT